jgi:RNA polymerase sigma-70 factor (ECF subfamily)
LGDDERIEALAQGGQSAQKAIASLYLEFAPVIRRRIARMVAEVSDADEITQETFVRVTANPGSYRGEGAVGGWLMKIAKHCLIDHYRRKKRLPPLLSVEEWEHGLPADDGDDPELVDCVRNGFARFTQAHPARGEALRLAALEGWTMAELAAHLKRSVGATREFVSQCRKVFAPFVAHCATYLLLQDEVPPS